MSHSPRFIESSAFPLNLVNKASAKEKEGRGKPSHWEFVFWWTRKPLAGARALIAGSLLPDNFDKIRFIKMLRLDTNSPHRFNPAIPQEIRERYFKGRKILDPFAGFGSIPLEAIRLGADAVAVELLPSAYVFLKAVLEYPLSAVNDKEWAELAADVKKWGEWVIQQLKEDPDIKALYPPDVAVYIGSWEIKCPACGRYTPLIGNWWLAKTEDKKGYRRLVWMEWNDGLKIRDLNKELRLSTLRAIVEKNTILVGGKEYVVRNANIKAKKKTALCLHCRVEIDHRVLNDGRVIKSRKKEGEWYVKHALRNWNENLERFLSGKITLEQLTESLTRPILLVRVYLIGREIEFRLATKEDEEMLWKALDKLRTICGDPDIPHESLVPYQMGTAGTFGITLWGFDKFYKLFNSRQLLTLIKLVKIVREAGKKIEEEKIREGWDREKAFKYAEAVATYLTIALCKHVNYNSIVTSVESKQKIVRETLSFRGIAMTWNWVDENPLTNITGSLTRSLENVIEGLNYLINAVFGSSGKVRVLLDDASLLSKIGGEKFDLVVTDPPYADDVPYAELSDFYYVWLKRALSDVDGKALKPRFLREAFFDEFGIEISTQWQNFARYEVSDSPGRFKYFGMKEKYSDLLTSAFANIIRHLDDNGIMITYYVAKKQKAWLSLIEALWKNLGMVITAAYPLQTEMAESIMSRGKAAVTGGFVIVWRRREDVEGFDVLDLADSEQRRNLIELISAEFNKYKNFKENFFIFSFIACLSALLRYREIKRGGVPLSVKDIVSVASSVGFEGALKAVGIEIEDPIALSYLLLRLASPNNTIDSGTLTYITYATGIEDSEMIEKGLILPIESSGPKVAKRKTYIVNVPKQAVPSDIAASLSNVRGKSIVMEAFRELQLAVLTPGFRFEEVKKRYIEVSGEVMALSEAFVELGRRDILSNEDPDVKTSKMILGIALY